MPLSRAEHALEVRHRPAGREQPAGPPRESPPLAQPVERLGPELTDGRRGQPHPGVAIDHVGDQLRQPRGIEPAARNVREIAGRERPRHPLIESPVEQRLVLDALFRNRLAKAPAQVGRLRPRRPPPAAPRGSARARRDAWTVACPCAASPPAELEVGGVRGHDRQLVGDERSHRALQTRWCTSLLPQALWQSRQPTTFIRQQWHTGATAASMTSRARSACSAAQPPRRWAGSRESAPETNICTPTTARSESTPSKPLRRFVNERIHESRAELPDSPQGSIHRRWVSIPGLSVEPSKQFAIVLRLAEGRRAHPG